MSELKISKTRASVVLVGGLVIAGWSLWDHVQRPELPQVGFWLGLNFIAIAVQQLADASSEAQRGVHGAFVLVLFGALLWDLVHAIASNSPSVWILAVVTLGMALAGLYWFRSAGPSPAPREDSGP